MQRSVQNTKILSTTQITSDVYKGIFIPYNVPSSKNHRINFVLKNKDGSPKVNPDTGKIMNMSFPSKSVTDYIKSTEMSWIAFRKDFLFLVQEKPKPYRIQLFFVRGTQHKFDFINACQIVADLMVKYKWIDDDNCDEVLFYPPMAPNPAYEHHKHNSGLYIQVI